MNEITLSKANEIEIDGGVAKCANVGQMLAMAQMMMSSGFVPSSFKTAQAVVMAIQYGAELKLSPVASLNSIAVINGKPSLYGSAVPGVATSSGQLEDWKEWIEGDGDNAKACCKVKRKGIESPMLGEFSAQDAKQAGLWKKAGPWTLYPKDMLKWKARARAFRALFGDVLCGMPVYEDLVGTAEAKPLKPTVSIVDPLQASAPKEGDSTWPTSSSPVEAPEPGSYELDDKPAAPIACISVVKFKSVVGSAAKGFTLTTTEGKIFSTPMEEHIAVVKQGGRDATYLVTHFEGLIEKIEVQG